MKRLTNNAEKLLKEILEHRNDDGICNTQYWKERFDDISPAEDALLRSLFKELIDANMISVRWADNYPYLLFLLGNGVSYFEEKQQMENEKKNNSIMNVFYGTVSGVQIQQATSKSTQTQSISSSLDDLQVMELVQIIKKYDTILDTEYGKENAEKIRNAAAELSDLSTKTGDEDRKKGLIAFIRDLSVNAGGGLVAAGIIQLISSMMR